MLGAIIGDIAGSAYEFHNTNDYNCDLFPKESNYTDDTVMTMAVASWFLKDPEHTHKVLEQEMVRFANEYRCPKGGATAEDSAVGFSIRKTGNLITPGATDRRCA